MAEPIIVEPAEMKNYLGKELGVSDWVEVTQEKINLFADATGDHQWIHTDPEKAKELSPYGTTIAHGYWTISLAPMLLSQIIVPKGIKMAINYGINRLRLPNAVKVNSRVRMRAELVNLEEVPGGYQGVFKLTFEIEGEEKPGCVAEVVYRYYV